MFRIDSVARRFVLTATVLFSAAAFGQQQEIPVPSLAEYSRFEMRPVRSLAPVHPAVYGKFSAALAKFLDSHTSRWAESDRKNKSGKRLIIEVSIVDSKFVSGRKRFFIGPIAGSSHMGARVEFIDDASGEVIGREFLRTAAGAMAGTFTVGATDNKMITALAQQAADCVTTSLAFQPENDAPTVETSIEAPTGETDAYDKLIKLDELRQKGIITDEEFTKEKEKILGGT